MNKKRKLNIPIYKNLSSVIENSEALILDIWGVLWDGIKVYPEALVTLNEIKKLDIPVILLSNAPRRASNVERKLNRVGIDKSLYNEIISSGEICRNELISKRHQVPGNNYYFIGLNEDRDLLNNSSFHEVKEIDKANFILLTGPRSFDDKVVKYSEELKSCRKRNLPMVSANPDKVVIRQNGEIVVCAGQLAKYYSNMGGFVKEFGKPHEEIFLEALKKFKSLKINIDKNKISIIGDGLETDIAGGNIVGINTVLVTSGILSQELNTKYKEMPDKELLYKIIKRSKFTPDAVVISFGINS
ncbi:MAG: hypothetical protein CFH32_00270 [Alphaproteobacteria bacterium MarineAlpha9_Bin2]|nr:MAG: hypothetical protein CFH32_00270 [Alphaproteobacteria bacterium MarineAlpha9_Bin2]